ncbi:unnamed protein product [Oikopleura dioica]|uniref:Uncharacterized protein n=1 Tax=Oikopleura dioica TaxID=34765 RepID=E4XXG1_OIKDI|nr:unnamed protein product [Oikopleura dioica]CBY41528.1 unnamed protein product [Oikopleura dioica]
MLSSSPFEIFFLRTKDSLF